MPAGNAINGWDDPHSRKFAPNLEHLGSAAEAPVNPFIKKLYLISSRENNVYHIQYKWRLKN